jgi:protein-tyrosine phosphatase
MTPRDPDCYWVEDGRFLAGAYPAGSGEAAARGKLAGLLDAGIRYFVDLTEDGELRGYEDWLTSEAAARGIEVRYQRLPIVDRDVPSVSRMREILTTIERAISAHAPVYVHCWGGIGRTGTVVGCWLVERGHMGISALTQLDVLREKKREPSPEMPEQIEFVRTWATGRRRKAGELPPDGS